MPLKDPARETRAQANDPRYCPLCGTVGKRIATRREVNGVHRRRQCINTQCNYRWTGIELDLDRVRVVTELERKFAEVLVSMRKHHPGAMPDLVCNVPRTPLPDVREGESLA